MIPLAGGAAGRRQLAPKREPDVASKPRFDYLNFGADSDNSSDGPKEKPASDSPKSSVGPGNGFGTDAKRGVTLAAGPSIVDIGGPSIGLGGIGGLGQGRNRDSALFGSGTGSQEPAKRASRVRNDGNVNVEASADFGGAGKSSLLPAQGGLRGSQGGYLPGLRGLQDSAESKKAEAAPDAPAGGNKFTSKPSLMINRPKDSAQ